MNKKIAVAVILPVLTVILVLNILSPAFYEIGPFSVQMQVSTPAKGGTILHVPPLGEVQAQTHFLPVRLQAKLMSIHPEEIEGFLSQSLDEDEALALLEEDFRHMAYRYFLRLAIISIIAGALGALFWSRSFLSAVMGGFRALIFFVLLAALIIVPYNISAFEEPTYVGILEGMPWFVRVIEESLENYPIWQDNILRLTENLASYYFSVEAFDYVLGSEENKTRILHVTDIHNNPLAISVIESMVNNLNVDFIIDTGDLTDYGTALELKLTGGIKDLDIPYLFVPGNHESPEVIAALRDIKNVTVLDGSVVSYEGINILGLADPASAGKDFRSLDDVERVRQEYDELLAAADTEVDIVATHDFRFVEHFVGRVPMLVFGHNHQQEYKEVDGTHLINAGTTGAEGFRGLQIPHETPYTAVLITLDGDKNPVTIDLLKVTQRTSSFSIQRIFLP